MHCLNKLLMGVKENSQVFSLPNKNFVLGLTTTQVKELKKEAINQRLIFEEKKNYYLTKEGKSYLKNNPVLSWKSQDYPKRPDINLEYLKKEKTPPAVTKAIRDIAKSLLDMETLKEDSVEGYILKEIQDKCIPLIDELQDSILSGDRVFINNVFDKFISYGLTKSIVSVLLLIALSKNKDKIAIYEKGQFQLKLNYLVFDRMIFAPQNFELQKTEIDSYPILEDLSEVVLPIRTNNILDITKGLLYSIRKLDKYALNSERLSNKAIRFRNTIMSAKDPVKLFERDIPKVLIKNTLFNADNTLVKEFEDVIMELQFATANMEEEVRKFTFETFNCSSRKELSDRFLVLNEYLGDSELKIFYKNVVDTEEDDNLWFRRIATFINKYRVPKDWFDSDVADYKVKIKELALKINAIESIVDSLNCQMSDSFKRLLDDIEKLSKPEKNILLKKIVNG